MTRFEYPKYARLLSRIDWYSNYYPENLHNRNPADGVVLYMRHQALVRARTLLYSVRSWYLPVK